MSLHPETLHGLHYSEEQFDAELEKRVQQQVDSDGDDWDEDDRSSYQRHFMKELYAEWNPGTDSDDFLRFEMANSMKYRGMTTSGYTTESNSAGNPLLEPIHGISLKDYAAIAMNLESFDQNTLFSAFGIDAVIWDEVNTLWPKRMQEDETFTVTTLYGQYFMEVSKHPVILSLQGSQEDKPVDSNLEKLKTDRYFYEELSAARNAAYEYGIDGAQWIQDNYGVGLMDFQSVAMEWMTNGNLNYSTDEVMHYQNYQDEKYEEYKAKFAAEQGGNVADDVEF